MIFVRINFPLTQSTDNYFTCFRNELITLQNTATTSIQYLSELLYDTWRTKSSEIYKGKKNVYSKL